MASKGDDAISEQTLDHLEKCSYLLAGLPPQCLISVNYARQELLEKSHAKRGKSKTATENLCHFCFSKLPDPPPDVSRFTCPICKRTTKVEKSSVETTTTKKKHPVLPIKPQKKKKKTKEENAGLVLAPKSATLKANSLSSTHSDRLKSKQNKDRLKLLLNSCKEEKKDSQLQGFLKLL